GRSVTLPARGGGVDPTHSGYDVDGEEDDGASECFYCRYGDHRDLHSFPTRRSSDLVGSSPPARGASGCSSRASQAGTSATTGSRSEEHTSELQSQSNLVCRLLLEKKKSPSLNAEGPGGEQVVNGCTDCLGAHSEWGI